MKRNDLVEMVDEIQPVIVLYRVLSIRNGRATYQQVSELTGNLVGCLYGDPVDTLRQASDEALREYGMKK